MGMKSAFWVIVDWELLCCFSVYTIQIQDFCCTFLETQRFPSFSLVTVTHSYTRVNHKRFEGPILFAYDMFHLHHPYTRDYGWIIGVIRVLLGCPPRHSVVNYLGSTHCQTWCGTHSDAKAPYGMTSYRTTSYAIAPLGKYRKAFWGIISNGITRQKASKPQPLSSCFCIS